MAEAPAEDGGAEVRVEECDVVPCEGAGVRVHGGGEPAPALLPGPAPPPGHAPPVAAQPGDVLPEGAEPPHLGPPRQPVQAPAPEPGLGYLRQKIVEIVTRKRIYDFLNPADSHMYLM